MDPIKVSIWKDSRGYCLQQSDEPTVYVFGTKRSLINAAEKCFNENFEDGAEKE